MWLKPAIVIVFVALVISLFSGAFFLFKDRGERKRLMYSLGIRITLAATLAVVPTIPVAGLALILGIDRFMSEARALTNFIGNGVATVVVAHWEKELDKNAMNEALKS